MKGESSRATSDGFTLVELMVSISVLAVIFLIASYIIEGAHRTWRVTEASVTQYQEARSSFESMGQRIARAQLNPRLDYEYRNMLPVRYKKETELHFLNGRAEDLVGGGSSRPGHAIFFQAPLGMSWDPRYHDLNHLLNAWGFFVEYGSDEAWAPSIVRSNPRYQPRYRFRLMEFRQPAEDLVIYSTFDPADRSWYRDYLTPENVKVVAENVIALVLTPLSPGERDPHWLAPEYAYDSRMPESMGNPAVARAIRHELPPVVRITLIAIDEKTALRFETEEGEPPEELMVFKVAPFARAEEYDQDLAEVEKHLDSISAGYRVFTSTVAIRNAKWKLGRWGE